MQDFKVLLKNHIKQLSSEFLTKDGDFNLNGYSDVDNDGYKVEGKVSQGVINSLESLGTQRNKTN